MVEIRIRTRITWAELEQKIGKILVDADYNALLTNTTKVLKPDGSPLLVYLPGALAPALLDESYATLHALRAYTTENRGKASGMRRDRVSPGGRSRTTESVPSAIIGAFDPVGPKQYCRLTAFTATEGEKFAALFPLFQAIGRAFQAYVPDRFQAQMMEVGQTAPEWVVPGTPFTTITVNNTYPTGVHTDKGDLDGGFSTLAVLRRGNYTGGRLVFPEFRLAVDMQHGDLLLMDAHEFHGNTAMHLLPSDEEEKRAYADSFGHVVQAAAKAAGGGSPAHEAVREAATAEVDAAYPPDEELNSDQAERISVVCYYRTRLVNCGTAAEELKKAEEYAERHNVANPK